MKMPNIKCNVTVTSLCQAAHARNSRTVSGGSSQVRSTAGTLPTALFRSPQTEWGTHARRSSWLCKHLVKIYALFRNTHTRTPLISTVFPLRSPFLAWSLPVLLFIILECSITTPGLNSNPRGHCQHEACSLLGNWPKQIFTVIYTKSTRCINTHTLDRSEAWQNRGAVWRGGVTAQEAPPSVQRRRSLDCNLMLEIWNTNIPLYTQTFTLHTVAHRQSHSALWKTPKMTDKVREMLYRNYCHLFKNKMYQ